MKRQTLMLALMALVVSKAVAAESTTTAPEAWLTGLPANAVTNYKLARYGGRGKDLQLALRTWMSVWLNSLRDPARAMIQLDYVGVICEDAAQFVEGFKKASQKQGVVARYTTTTIGDTTVTEVERGRVKIPTQTAAEKTERASALREARQTLQTIRVRTRQPEIMAAIADKQAEVEQLLKFYEQ
ncbi:MAG: hypothetical protein WA117_21265 [Verrucomicrobiia bacterium]